MYINVYMYTIRRVEKRYLFMLFYLVVSDGPPYGWGPVDEKNPSDLN